MQAAEAATIGVKREFVPCSQPQDFGAPAAAIAEKIASGVAGISM
jgi:hypothetical protein